MQHRTRRSCQTLGALDVKLAEAKTRNTELEDHVTSMEQLLATKEENTEDEEDIMSDDDDSAEDENYLCIIKFRQLRQYQCLHGDCKVPYPKYLYRLPPERCLQQVGKGDARWMYRGLDVFHCGCVGPKMATFCYNGGHSRDDSGLVGIDRRFDRVVRGFLTGCTSRGDN